MPDKAAHRPITVAIPVKDDRDNLEHCLARLDGFPEVVVIDSGSTDGTRQVAQAHGATVLDFAWTGGYPKKRNWFLLNGQPNQPWVLFLDADEYVDERFCQAAAEAVTSGECNGFWLTYTNYFLDKRLRHGVPQRKLALFRVGYGLYERIDEDHWSDLDMEVHEHPIVEGKIGEIKTPIDHRDYKGLSKFIERHRGYACWESQRSIGLRDDHDAWSRLTGRQKFKYRNIDKWWFPWFYFFYAYLIRLGLLDGRAGFNYALYKAWYFQTTRLMIREQLA